MLLRAVGSDDLEQMITDPQGQIWRSEGFAEDMKIELGRAYDPCMGLVKNIAGTLETIAANLNIEGSDRIRKEGLQAVVSANPPDLNTTDGGSRFHFRKRVDFTMKRRDVIRSLKAIEEDNERLHAAKLSSEEDDTTRNQQNMLALAIMLLELNFGVPIESLRQASDMGADGQPNAFTDLLTAQRWFNSKSRKGQLSHGFKSAIKFCLQCYVDPDASFENAEFTQAIEDQVLKPLESEMQQLVYGGS
ncbi:hypothetical protein K4K58_009564 [Colletotrichum sp. SAR11_239]|nr:hypothetical protein K4K58_009564 [Colletotrichum sp. SAR11_239]